MPGAARPRTKVPDMSRIVARHQQLGSTHPVYLRGGTIELRQTIERFGQ